MTYHISKNGIPQICKAQEGKCPLGTKHFDNLEEASIHADSLNEKTELISRFKNAKTPGQRLKTRKLIWNLNEKLGLEKNNGIPETKKSLPNLDKIKEIKKSEEEKTLKNIKNFEDLEYIKMPENIQKIIQIIYTKKNIFQDKICINQYIEVKWKQLTKTIILVQLCMDKVAILQLIKNMLLNLVKLEL